MAVQTQILHRRGTAASWTSTNPTLGAGEIGFETDTGKYKIGDGSSVWTSLGYASILPSTVTTKGDLLAATGNAAVSRLAVGSDGYTPVADSSTSTGLNYMPTGFAGKNKLINGAMTVAQRGTAAISITSTNTTIYGSTDRWFGIGTGGGVFSVAQSTTAPAGFGYSSLITVTTADSSIAAGDYYLFGQRIEGYNANDFAFGTSSAKTLTLSFWIRSSVTGTYSVCMSSSSEDRWYVGTYTINSANTWEYKTVTITGCTDGTWNKDNTSGAAIYFTIGNGSTFDATAGAWNTSAKFGTSGSTDLIGTLNATMYVTGVQLEVGSTATTFQTATGTIQGELAACQRYYIRYQGTSTTTLPIGAGSIYATNEGQSAIIFPVIMRAAPSPTASGSTIMTFWRNGSNFNSTSVSFSNASPNGVNVIMGTSGQTAGQAGVVVIDTPRVAGANIELSAEL